MSSENKKNQACCIEMQPYLDQMIELGENPENSKSYLREIHEFTGEVANKWNFEDGVKNIIASKIRFTSDDAKVLYLQACQRFVKEGLLNLEEFHLAESFEAAIQDHLDKLNNVEGLETSDQPNEWANNKNPEFTTARQVLAILYLLKNAGMRNIDNTEVARFAQFLTGRETGARTIGDTTIYKWVKSPLRENQKNLRNDLMYVKEFFVKLGLNNIVKAIDSELINCED